MSIEIKDTDTLTEEQQRVYDLIESGRNVFVTGCGGSGKTFLIRYYVKNTSNKKKNNSIGVTSTTGVSAVLIGGVTIHSFLGLGIGTGDVELLYERISNRRYILQRWKKIKTLIIDEVSMLDPTLFEKIDQLFRIIRSNNRPFGGVQIIATGDFLQIAPVKADKYCFQTEAWSNCNFHVAQLVRNVRQEDDAMFTECLKRMRLGDIDSLVCDTLAVRENIEFDRLDIQPTYLFPLKRHAHAYNMKKYKKLIESEDVERHKYEATIEVLDPDVIQRKDRIIENTRIDKTLDLAVGAQVVLTTNLDVNSGLSNGSRGVILSFTRGSLPVVKFMNDIETVVDYHTFEIEEMGDTIMTVEQIPLKLAYAMTIHSAQGGTLDCAVIDMANVFEYGQAYVACSRVRKVENLYFKKRINYRAIKAHPAAVEFYNNLSKN